MTHRTMAERIERSRQRATRRETLLILLNRADRLSAAEATRLAEHARAELAEADELRRTVQGQQRAMQDAITRTRAAEAAIVEVEAERDQAWAALERARSLPQTPQVQVRIYGMPGQEDYNRGWSSAISAIRAALDEHQEQP